MNKFSWTSFVSWFVAMVTGYFAVFHTLFSPVLFKILSTVSFAGCLGTIAFAIVSGVKSKKWIGPPFLFLTGGIITLMMYLSFALLFWAFESIH